jgi:uncharacterized protein
MNFLLTGASGFIGRTLVKRLLATGHEVNYLARERSRHVDMRAAFHFWRPGEPPPLDSVPRCDAIINLAGEPIAQRWNEEVKHRLWTSRVDGTRLLLESVGGMRNRPRVLVSASATGYYGDRGDEVLTESSAPGDDFLANMCVHWEKEAWRGREMGMRVVPIRIAAVLGKNGGALPTMLGPFRLGLGGRFGSGRQWMPWIHLDDIVRLLMFAAESEVEGPLNGSSPGLVTNGQFTNTFAKAIHRPAIFPVPRLALRMVLGELADFLFASERVVPERTEGAGFRFEHPELKSALKSILG